MESKTGDKIMEEAHEDKAGNPNPNSSKIRFNFNNPDVFFMSYVTGPGWSQCLSRA